MEVGLAKVPAIDALKSTAFFSALFPFHILNRRLDAAAQEAAIKAEIEKAFKLAHR